jgi:hypothetical protein
MMVLTRKFSLVGNTFKRVKNEQTFCPEIFGSPVTQAVRNYKVKLLCVKSAHFNGITKKYFLRRKTNLTALALINSLFSQKRILFLCQNARFLHASISSFLFYSACAIFLHSMIEFGRPIARSFRGECISAEGTLDLLNFLGYSPEVW